ncbi:MAG TPA: 4Fe-4S dicluster domain-containing protein, partial [Pseudonocardiaceae bacterium]|nr:4Fe-4S dicluster domain-containing protein [Pseudonocardiaceae bacterium]
GIEKLVPTWRDLEVFLQLLPRSSTAERMNPYTSVWSGVTPGDGPRKFHLVLLDNGRTATLADQVGSQALRCIRCSACLNVCPVYERTGGQAYGSVYPGPIGAILAPQLAGDPHDPQATSLPYASSLCGACYQVCPVRINIPEVLTHLRAESVRAKGKFTAEAVGMAALAWVLRDPFRYETAQRAGSLARLLGRNGRITRLPGPGAKWTAGRDAPVPPQESFRTWWKRNHG